MKLLTRNNGETTCHNVSYRWLLSNLGPGRHKKVIGRYEIIEHDRFIRFYRTEGNGEFRFPRQPYGYILFTDDDTDRVIVPYYACREDNVSWWSARRIDDFIKHMYENITEVGDVL